jgi:2-oxoglutarate ferredoxin oxidoreductase subunit alpha
VEGVAVPDQEVCLGGASGALAVVGWGSTFGPIHQAVRRARAKGLDVSHIHVRHIWPLPANLGDLLHGFDAVLVPEMNTGQFKTVLRDQFLVDAQSLTKTSGQPFQIAEMEAAIAKFFDGIPGNEGGEVPPNEQQLPVLESGHDDGSYPDAPFHGADSVLHGEDVDDKQVLS